MSSANKQMDDMIRRMTWEIEHELFYGIATPKKKLMVFLQKLGVKSAVTGTLWNGLSSQLRK